MGMFQAPLGAGWHLNIIFLLICGFNVPDKEEYGWFCAKNK